MTESPPLFRKLPTNCLLQALYAWAKDPLHTKINMQPMYEGIPVPHFSWETTRGGKTTYGDWLMNEGDKTVSILGVPLTRGGSVRHGIHPAEYMHMSVTGTPARLVEKVLSKSKKAGKIGIPALAALTALSAGANILGGKSDGKDKSRYGLSGAAAGGAIAAPLSLASGGIADWFLRSTRYARELIKHEPYMKSLRPSRRAAIQLFARMKPVGNVKAKAIVAAAMLGTIGAGASAGYTADSAYRHISDIIGKERK